LSVDVQDTQGAPRKKMKLKCRTEETATARLQVASYKDCKRQN